MKKLTKKLFISILTVALTFIALGTSTFAWFSMNNTVAVTGMQVRTQTSDNLFIAASTTDATVKADEANFKTTLVKNVSALLEPVSTINGVTFFYNATNNVAGDGNALADTYIAYDLTAVDNKGTFNNNFENNYSAAGAVGFVDYAFQLKAINTANVAKNVVVETLKLTYGASTDVDKAFRVAIFVNDMGADGATAATAPTADSLLSILRQSGAAYFTTDQAVTSTTALAAVNAKIDDAATIGTVTANTTHYYKVVVRLWLEGEDSTCNNTTFATLTDAWQLDLTIKLAENNSTNGVTNFTQLTTNTKENLVGAAVDANAAATIIAGVSYYPITSHDGFYATHTGAIVKADHIYKIEANKPIDVTNQCTMPNA